MFKDISFGQYYPSNSFIHKLDARTKLLLTIVFIVALFFIPSNISNKIEYAWYGYFGYMMTFAVLLTIIILARVPIASILKSVRGVLLIIVIMAVINLFVSNQGEVLWAWRRLHITDAAIHTTIKLILRLVMLIIGASILPLTTTPVALSDGLESLLKPLKVIRVPVHDMAMILSIALRFIPTLFEETQKIIATQKARGASFDTGNIFKRAKALIPILIPLFVSSFRRADELAFAMDSRCYNATSKRTKYRVSKMGWRDALAFIFMNAYLVAVLMDRYYWVFEMDRIIFGGWLGK